MYYYEIKNINIMSKSSKNTMFYTIDKRVKARYNEIEV